MDVKDVVNNQLSYVSGRGDPYCYGNLSDKPSRSIRIHFSDLNVIFKTWLSVSIRFQCELTGVRKRTITEMPRTHWRHRTGVNTEACAWRRMCGGVCEQMIKFLIMAFRDRTAPTSVWRCVCGYISDPTQMLHRYVIMHLMFVIIISTRCQLFTTLK